MYTFLGVNGREIVAAEAEVVQLMLDVAAHACDEAALVTWLRAHVDTLTDWQQRSRPQTRHPWTTQMRDLRRRLGSLALLESPHANCQRMGTTQPHAFAQFPFADDRPAARSRTWGASDLGVGFDRPEDRWLSSAGPLRTPTRFRSGWSDFRVPVSTSGALRRISFPACHRKSSRQAHLVVVPCEGAEQGTVTKLSRASAD